jgi:hypothetical protein
LIPAAVKLLKAQHGYTIATFSMVAVGFISMYAWEALSFDRRDAMVLGPLPLRAVTFAPAKLGALAAFLACAAASVNLPTAVVFALTMSGELGTVVGIVALELAGRRRAVKWTVRPREEPADAFSSATVLDLGGAVQRTGV